MRSAIGLCLCFTFLFAGFMPARAQAAARVELYDFRNGAFPEMSTGMDVFDPSGNLLTGLAPADVTVLEDGQARPAETLVDSQPGVEFALALDPGPAFAFRDAQAVSRYDKVYNLLQAWAASHADSLGDDLSLVPTEGSLSPHLASSVAFANALQEYSPPLALIRPTLNTLSRALDTVSDKAPVEGMKRSVLYVTSPPDLNSVATVVNLTEKAVGLGVRVNVWIVVSKSNFNTSGAAALKDLSTQTGGQYILFSGEEPLPGLETYLAPLRHAYRLTYRSGLTSPGAHEAQVMVQVNGEIISSAKQSFDVDIQPPNPILVSPPDQIVRQAADERTTDPQAFFPLQQKIDILIEFPDGRTRGLASTSLYVDDQKVAENTSAPFDRFTWDLRSYTASGTHLLKVEAVDELGLRRISVPVPVNVTVVQPKTGPLAFISRNRNWFVAVAILLAGALLGALLTSTRLRNKKPHPPKAARQDPLTQAVSRTRAERRRGLFAWAHTLKAAEAYLVRVKDDGQSLTTTPIAVVTPEMTFGSDPLKVTRMLDDPSVSAVHARIREEKGAYILTDEKSAAGTWVNFEQISGPTVLDHGDLLQIGRFTYRFLLRKEPPLPTPTVTPTKP